MATLRFGIVGQYQSGKSLLINCLLERNVATVGVGLPTTHTVVNYSFSESEYIEIEYDSGIKETWGINRLKGVDTDNTIQTVNVFLNNDFLKDYTLTDMPGFGSNDKDNKAALGALADIDYAIVVVPNERSLGTESAQYKDFCILQRYDIPYYLILNCKDIVIADKWCPFSDINKDIMNEDLHLLEFYTPICYPFEEGSIPIVNLMWYWYAIREKDDKILIRNEIQNAINTYDLPLYSPSEIKAASNFQLIQRIFDMDNRAYLELKKEIQALKDEICPIGTIQAFALNKIPPGWIECDGRKLNKNEYLELFNAIGHTFSTKVDHFFNIPDLRGRFIRGWDKETNLDVEPRKFGSYQDDALQTHSHMFDAEKLKISQNGRHYHPLWCDQYDTVVSIISITQEKAKRMCYPSNSGGSGRTDLGPYAGEHDHTVSIVDSPINAPTNIGSNIVMTSSETRPKNCALLYCIRVK